MSKIIQLGIKYYRGIKELNLNFDPDQNLICFIGRGDTGKSTILSAISFVLSPNWNLSFYDTDFYNCDVNNPIEIFATLIEIPEKLLLENKFGLYSRGFDPETKQIVDDVTGNAINIEPILTVKLFVDSSLEPQWTITNKREQEDKQINAQDRSLFNCNIVSDYVDSHFSWNKGNPLYSLLQSINSDDDLAAENIIIQHLRAAKKAIDANEFENFNEATAIIIKQAAELGLNITDTKTTLDSRELTIKDGRISLHENSVPFRLKGKGSKRLSSIAIQSAVVNKGGIMLIDEIEQGLEPDRIQQIVRTLKDNLDGQIFVTTHSREAIVEMGSNPLILILKDYETDELKIKQFTMSNDELQKTVRACSEAFFAKKVIVCEGATEVGICRALDKWRIENGKRPMAFQDCAYIDGHGDSMEDRVKEIHAVGLNTSLFCDSDKQDINEQKVGWERDGIRIFDCQDSFCIEKQVFTDLSWAGIKELTEYVINTFYKNEQAFIDAIQSKYADGDIPGEWGKQDSPELRMAIAETSIVKKKEWFKTIHHGERLGEIMFGHINEMSDGVRLRDTLLGLSSWVDS